MVVGVNRVNRDQVGKALEVLQTVGASVLGVVANLLPAKGPDAYMYTHYRYKDGGKREAPAEHDQPNEHVTA